MQLKRNVLISHMTEFRSVQSVLVLTLTGKILQVDVNVYNAEIEGYNFAFADFPTIEDDYLLLSHSSACLSKDGAYELEKGSYYHFAPIFKDNLNAVESYLQNSQLDFSTIDRRSFRSKEATVFVSVSDYNTVITIPTYQNS